MRGRVVIAVLAAFFAATGYGSIISGASQEGMSENSSSASNTFQEANKADESEQADLSAQDEYYGTPEYTYHLSTKWHYDYLDADDGSDQTIAYVHYEWLEIEPQTDALSGADGAERTGASGNDADATSAPAGVVSAVEAINNDTLSSSGTFLAKEGKDAQEYYASLSEGDRVYFGGYADENTLSVRRADSLCLSIVRDHYQSFAGAHPYTSTTAYNFDAQSGTRLKISDVVADPDALAGILAAELLKTHVPAEFNNVSEEQPQADLTARIQRLMDGDEYYEGDNDLHYVTWYLGPGTVEFVFNQYDLGPYAAGQFHVTLKGQDDPELLLAQYLYGPDSYIEELSLHTYYKIDGETFVIGDYEDEYQTVQSIQVYYGEKEADFEVWGYNVRALLMTIPAGKYLYLDIISDSDWHDIYCLDLGAQELEARKLEGLGFENDAMDPYYTVLTTRFWLLSSLSGAKTFYPDPSEGGLLVSDDEYYRMIDYGDGGIPLTLKQDAQLNILDDLNGTSTHKETVQKGTTMYVIRTDGESIVDCQAEDGLYIRFTVGSSWPQIIDGTWELTDLLDGTVFAS